MVLTLSIPDSKDFGSSVGAYSRKPETALYLTATTKNQSSLSILCTVPHAIQASQTSHELYLSFTIPHSYKYMLYKLPEDSQESYHSQ